MSVVRRCPLRTVHDKEVSCQGFYMKPSARSEFFFLGGMPSRVPWGWHDSYGKTGNFGRVGDKSMFKMHKKGGVGREGDI